MSRRYCCRRLAVGLIALFAIGLWDVPSVLARRIAVLGSVELSTSLPLTTQLVALVVIANPGLEKTIVQQLPLPGSLYIAQFAVSKDTVNPGGGDFETILLLTNATGGSLPVTVVMRGSDGTVLATAALPPLAARETRALLVSDLLP